MSQLDVARLEQAKRRVQEIADRLDCVAQEMDVIAQLIRDSADEFDTERRQDTDAAKP
jgi:hypothetical protein